MHGFWADRESSISGSVRPRRTQNPFQKMGRIAPTFWKDFPAAAVAQTPNIYDFRSAPSAYIYSYTYQTGWGPGVDFSPVSLE